MISQAPPPAVFCNYRKLAPSRCQGELRQTFDRGNCAGFVGSSGNS